MAGLPALATSIPFIKTMSILCLEQIVPGTFVGTNVAEGKKPETNGPQGSNCREGRTTESTDLPFPAGRAGETGYYTVGGPPAKNLLTRPIIRPFPTKTAQTWSKYSKNKSSIFRKHLPSILQKNCPSPATSKPTPTKQDPKTFRRYPLPSPYSQTPNPPNFFQNVGRVGRLGAKNSGAPRL